MPTKTIPSRLEALHQAEETLREKALEIIAGDEQIRLHLSVVEAAMDLSDTFRMFDTIDEDIKVAQVLGMRIFNAFGSSLKLSLSGYHQNSALIMRDILETVFLLDLFAGDASQIEQWRHADDTARKRKFSPFKVREALDHRDGFTSKRRAEIYGLFSDLAAHPNMKSAWMMRPQKDGDAVIGPFMATTALQAVLSEMGRLAVQVGEQINKFMPADWTRGLSTRAAFGKCKLEWISTFYPSDGRTDRS